MNLQKNKPLDDVLYREFVRSFPCDICGIEGETVSAHHTVSKGAGGGDETCIPVCHFHHHAFHTMGRDTFAEFYNVNIDELVKRMQAKWEEQNVR